VQANADYESPTTLNPFNVVYSPSILVNTLGAILNSDGSVTLPTGSYSLAVDTVTPGVKGTAAYITTPMVGIYEFATGETGLGHVSGLLVTSVHGTSVQTATIAQSEVYTVTLAIVML
jgi:hypothetical protein